MYTVNVILFLILQFSCLPTKGRQTECGFVVHVPLYLNCEIRVPRGSGPLVEPKWSQSENCTFFHCLGRKTKFIVIMSINIFFKHCNFVNYFTCTV